MKQILLALMLGLATREAVAQAVLQGTVVTADSVPIAGARIQVVESAGGDPYQAITDSTGSFRIRLAHPVRPGLFHVRSEMLGFRTLDRVPVQIGDRETVTVTLTMDVAAIPIEPLRVTTRGRYSRGPLDDYLDRAARVKRFGGGTIVDYDELQRRPHLEAARLIAENMPGARQCPPHIFIDGMRATPDDLRAIRLGSLEGVEIYRMAPMVPVQYQTTTSTCGAILFWTALDDHGKGSPITWRRIFIAAGILILGVVLLR